ncbi:MAG: MBL fold metallo-hydrolase [bacterium]
MKKNENMKVTFYGGVGSVTGANFLLEIPGPIDTKILVDCGLMQGEREAFTLNRKPFAYNPANIDFLFITHAHLDHVGRIPKLVRDGFKGVIYSTPETKELAKLILDDACGIMTRESKDQGVLPIYEEKDVATAMSLWKDISYHTKRQFNGGWSVVFRDAGHILGSSMIEFSWHDTKVVFTGDLGNSPATLLRDTENIPGANYLIMESVYGDRNHESHDERREKLKDAILSTIHKGGTLLIPAFSLERTQVILSEMDDFFRTSQIPIVPVFVDSPLAIKVTEVYKKYETDFNESSQERLKHGDAIFSFPKLRFMDKMSDSKMIERTPSPKIIIAGSGMSMGGRVLRHESELLPNPKNTILLIGYQAVGTLGRALEDGARKVTIERNEVNIHAEVRTITGYSSHKDSDHLLEFVEGAKDSLKQVFVVMGELKASLFLVQRIKDNIDVGAISPEHGQTYILE